MARADQLLIRQSAREPSAKETQAETESSALLLAADFNVRISSLDYYLTHSNAIILRDECNTVLKVFAKN